VAVPNCETNYVDRRLMLLRRKTLESSDLTFRVVNKDGHTDVLYIVMA